jgi:septal ring factor EnvC (AmiA/AmiB activator)
MIMKTIYALMIGLFFITVPVFAQEQPPSTADIVAKMQSKLNLTQDQVAAVTPIIDKYSSKREELRQSMKDGSADKDSIRSQMKQLKEDENQELSQVLSSDQMSQWEQMQSQERHKHSSEGGGNGSSGHGQ